MSPRRIFIAATLLGVAFLSACGLLPGQATKPANMPNPASVFCEQNGGMLELRQDASGGTFGVCVFADGSECEEWAYQRGECQPGDSLQTPASAQTATPEAFATDGCRVYHNDEMSYQFHYPADATIQANDDPLGGLTIVGPLRGNDRWPMISISHPADRAEFRPPDGANLVDWLSEHALLQTDASKPGAQRRLPDVQIADALAIHTRFDRSQQSYAYDKFFFVKSGQLYLIVIGHTGDYEDWTLYNHFLQTFLFSGS